MLASQFSLVPCDHWIIYALWVQLPYVSSIFCSFLCILFAKGARTRLFLRVCVPSQCLLPPPPLTLPPPCLAAAEQHIDEVRRATRQAPQLYLHLLRPQPHLALAPDLHVHMQLLLPPQQPKVPQAPGQRPSRPQQPHTISKLQTVGQAPAKRGAILTAYDGPRAHRAKGVAGARRTKHDIGLEVAVHDNVMVELDKCNMVGGECKGCTCQGCPGA